MGVKQNQVKTSDGANTSEKSPRYSLVDSVRGTAVILMVIFHFCFDLRYFGFVGWAVPNGEGWWQFRYLILTLFIGTVGISISLAQGQSYRFRAFWIRQCKLLLSAAAISLMSVFLFPNSWIYFGILHFILVASCFCLVLVRMPRLALVLGLGIIAAAFFDLVHPYWPFIYLREFLPATTEDFVPFVPWLGVAFLGLFIGHVIRSRNPDFCHLSEPITAKIGRHALPIYLLHQPLLFAVLNLYKWLSSLGG